MLYGQDNMYYDIEIFNALNSLANQSSATDMLIIFLADYVPYVVVLLLLSFLFLPRSGASITQEAFTKLKKERIKNRDMVLLAICSAIIPILIVKNIILFFYQRLRPYIALPLAHKLISVSTAENLQSFPSGHAMFFFAIATVVYLYHKTWGIAFFIIAILISISRVIAGVHYLSDVIGGAIIGIGIAYLSAYLFNYLKIKLKNNIINN